MLSKKMYAVRSSIEEFSTHFLPTSYQIGLYEGGIKLRDIVHQIMFECCEYAYRINVHEGSLISHISSTGSEYDAGDAKRVRLQRDIKYINDKASLLNDYVMNDYGMEIKSPVFDKDNNGRSYLLNDIDYLELSQVGDIELIKVVLERKFCSQKFYNDEFRSCSVNYDMNCMNMKEKSTIGSEELVLNSFAMFTLEQQYYFDFLYEIVDMMEKCHVKDLYDTKDRFTVFCYQPTISPALKDFTKIPYPDLTVNSTSVHLRRKFIRDIVEKEPGDAYDYRQAIYLEALYLVALFRCGPMYNDTSLQEWFNNNTNYEDWASVCSEYDIFDVFVPEKIWTNKKIRYAKNIYKEMTFNYAMSR